jgi:GrpB-like predicted nucleotidyltransferase (UPF0157 family)
MVGLERGTVELRSYQPEWESQYEAEVEYLESVAGERFLDYEHVGSTAVEGLAAKPVIDLLAVVSDLDEASELVTVLDDGGYSYRPNDGVDDRLFFAKGPRTNRTHYLSVCERTSDCYREQVAFRDYLRSNPEVAAEYERLKRDLAAEHSEDRSAYTERKSEFVERVLVRAMDGR